MLSLTLVPHLPHSSRQADDSSRNTASCMSLSTWRTLVSTHCPQDKICTPQISFQISLQRQTLPSPFPPPVKLPSHKLQSWSGGHVPSYVMGRSLLCVFVQTPLLFWACRILPFLLRASKMSPLVMSSHPGVALSTFLKPLCGRLSTEGCQPVFRFCIRVLLLPSEWWPRSLGVLSASCPGSLSGALP